MPERYVTADERATNSFADINAEKPCGGISVNGAEPPVCEVHLLPWGHARKSLDTASGDPT